MSLNGSQHKIGVFQTFTINNSAATNRLINKSLFAFQLISLGYSPRSGITGQRT